MKDHQNEKTNRPFHHSPRFELERDWVTNNWHIMMYAEHESGWIATFRHHNHAQIFMDKLKETTEENV